MSFILVFKDYILWALLLATFVSHRVEVFKPSFIWSNRNVDGFDFQFLNTIVG